MPTVALVTAPGSGTQFFRGLLEQHFGPVSIDEAKAGKPGYGAWHIGPNLLAALGEMPDLIVATTVRNVDAWRRSHAVRCGGDTEKFDTDFRLLARMILQFDPFVLSVDHPAREEMLADFGRALGVTFKTDWTPVNTTAERQGNG